VTPLRRLPPGALESADRQCADCLLTWNAAVSPRILEGLKCEGALSREGAVKEKIFNLFLFVENDIIVGLGARCHQPDGEKLALLQRQVKHDLPGAVRFPVPKRYPLVFSDGTTGTGLQYQSYQKLALLNRHLDLFEEVFA
jgi:hypothetical protein